MDQEVNSTPSTSAPPSPAIFPLDVELSERIGKAATAMARQAMRTRDNPMLTINTMMQVYQACVISAMLWGRGSESWTLYSRKEYGLNTFLCATSWAFCVSCDQIVYLTRMTSNRQVSPACLYSWPSAACGRSATSEQWTKVQFPKDILYWELAIDSRPAGSPVSRYKVSLQTRLEDREHQSNRLGGSGWKLEKDLEGMRPVKLRVKRTAMGREERA